MKKQALFISSMLLSTSLVSCNTTSPSTSYVEVDSYDQTTGEYILDMHYLQSNDINDQYDTYYEIFVGSFSDSNGDGVGDLRGLINKLDYLNDGDPNSGKSLGVTGIWLMPIFKGGSYHKYDVIDYYTVDPKYGTNEDLYELIAECHNRGIKLIIDLVINHTSSQNEWFIKFKEAIQNGDFNSKYASYYSYAHNSEKNSKLTYASIPWTNYSYECNFSGDMPELNFDNEEVRQETLNIAKFWLEKGIDGFRFDAAKYIYYTELQPNLDFWNWYMSELKKINSEVYCVGEVWSAETEIAPYYQNFSCFNFGLTGSMGPIANTAKGSASVNGFIDNIISVKDNIKQYNEEPILAPFIANHDMDRAAGFLTPATTNAHMAANLYLLSNGNPFIYYGEEIGLKGSRGSAPTDADRRLAMLWGDGDTVKDPNEAVYPASNQINGTVSEHIVNKTSLYNHYKKLIAIRNAFPEIARGELTNLNLDINSKVGGFIATYNDSSCMVIHNTSNEEVTIDLSAHNMNLVTSVGINSASMTDKVLVLGARTSAILR